MSQPSKKFDGKLTLASASRRVFEYLCEKREDEQELQLNRMEMKSIPFELTKFSQLQILWLSGNLMSSINANLGALTTLTELDLSDNQLEEIDGLELLNNLKVLDLDRNKLTKIQGLSTLVNLKTLSLAHNKIKHIEGLERLDELKELYLEDNGLEVIENLSHLVKLEELWLSNNKIADWSEVDKLTPLLALENVFLGGNPFVDNLGVEECKRRARETMPHIRQFDFRMREQMHDEEGT